MWWAWTTIDKFKPIVLSETRRRSLAAAERLNDGGTDQALVPVQPPPAKRTRASDEFVTLCNWLAQEGILTEQKWRATDLNGYVRQYASMHGRQQVAAALMMARNIILDTMSNSHFLTRGPPAVVATPAWEENRVVQLLRLQHYDPRVVGQYVLAWADGMTGKRNTLWFYGPPSTGKTNLANAICQCVPVYGMVNWTNENFPFNDAADKCLILWDEGRISCKIVEACKAILGGMPVRVDQKCKGSTALRPTPVLVTSNGDMTIVRDGNTSTLIHRPALKDRMVRLDFNVKLPAEYGLLTASDVRAWLAGCRDHPHWSMPSIWGLLFLWGLMFLRRPVVTGTPVLSGVASTVAPSTSSDAPTLPVTASGPRTTNQTQRPNCPPENWKIFCPSSTPGNTRVPPPIGWNAPFVVSTTCGRPFSTGLCVRRNTLPSQSRQPALTAFGSTRFSGAGRSETARTGPKPETWGGAPAIGTPKIH
ncbi:initiator NS1 family protein [Mesomycoplasma ovipneumoniae]